MSDWNPARPASRTRSWTFSGKILVTNCQMLRPPCRKKIRVNSTSSAPVTISVTVAAVDSAPLVSFAWLLRSASMAELPALLIWSLLRCAGPSISHVRAVSMLCVTCSTSPGRPVTNWLTTNVSMPPTIAMPLSSTSATAPPRGAPRRSRKSTAGIISAVSINANATGTTMTSSRRITHSNATARAMITSRRHDHAAALRMRGGTASSCTDPTEAMPVA